jgi:hypothetical protein
VANDNHNSVAKGPANVESLFNERGSYTEALEVRVHNKRCKCNGGSSCQGRFDSYRRKHDVPDYPLTMNCDKREFGIKNPAIPQGINKAGFIVMSKRLVVYLKNRRNICWRFRPDKKGIHPDVLVASGDKGDVGGDV